ncbi:MAG: thiol-disulfide isomerase-like protein [Halothiobacillaceae bacterium]|nr:MAG: thiol-disulfide isomerase-like protein [Halothiobacillaceae bacterium]
MRREPSWLNYTIFLTLWLMASGVMAAEKMTGLAPDFTLKSNSGANLKLSEYRGEVVMINFWASWCGPCRQEMPLLDKLYQQYKELGFVLLGVNVEEDSSKAKELLQDVTVSFPILFDEKNSVSTQYKLVAMPSTVLVDRDGNMRYFHAGYRPGDEAEYDKLIRELVRE